MDGSGSDSATSRGRLVDQDGPPRRRAPSSDEPPPPGGRHAAAQPDRGRAALAAARPATRRRDARLVYPSPAGRRGRLSRRPIRRARPRSSRALTRGLRVSPGSTRSRSRAPAFKRRVAPWWTSRARPRPSRSALTSGNAAVGRGRHGLVPAQSGRDSRRLGHILNALEGIDRGGAKPGGVCHPRLPHLPSVSIAPRSALFPILPSPSARRLPSVPSRFFRSGIVRRAQPSCLRVAARCSRLTLRSAPPKSSRATFSKWRRRLPRRCRAAGPRPRRGPPQRRSGRRARARRAARDRAVAEARSRDRPRAARRRRAARRGCAGGVLGRRASAQSTRAASVAAEPRLERRREQPRATPGTPRGSAPPPRSSSSTKRTRSAASSSENPRSRQRAIRSADVGAGKTRPRRSASGSSAGATRAASSSGSSAAARRAPRGDFEQRVGRLERRAARRGRPIDAARAPRRAGRRRTRGPRGRGRCGSGRPRARRRRGRDGAPRRRGGTRRTRRRGSSPGHRSAAASAARLALERRSDGPVSRSAPGNRSGAAASRLEAFGRRERHREPEPPGEDPPGLVEDRVRVRVRRITATRPGSRRAIARNAARTRSWNASSAASKRPAPRRRAGARARGPRAARGRRAASGRAPGRRDATRRRRRPAAASRPRPACW